ncbi:MAG: carbohydrate-binding family 9-like protein [Bacteroidota bacterium]
MADRPINIDGKDSDSAWANAPWSMDYIDIEGEVTPKYRTRMKMLWDDTYFYFFTQMEEPHVWGTLKQRDTVIFYNNDFEIFIDPDGDTHNYYEFEMNALNTVWDLFLTKPYRNGGKVIDSWDIQGLKTAVDIDGTLNDSRDTDTGWSVEIAIPWSVIMEASNGGQVPKGRFWRINFSRVNWDFDMNEGRYSRKKDAQGKYLPEYNWVWSPQGVVNMHEPEHWGYVYFAVDPKGGADFAIPEDDFVKRYLYEQYRKLRKAGGDFDQAIKAVEKSKGRVRGKDIRLKVEKHTNGWNLYTQSPFTKSTLLIAEDGKFHRIEP